MVNLPHVGDHSVSPASARAPGRTAEPRGLSQNPGALPGQNAASSAPLRHGDTVEFSPAARAAGEAPIRSDLVDRVRREIANGTYETDDKLEYVSQKLARMLDVRA
jgi:anti-sigma28 factor (negative regulator of flagellin synthesis)